MSLLEPGQTLRPGHTSCTPKMGTTRSGCKPTGMWFSTMAMIPTILNFAPNDAH